MSHLAGGVLDVMRWCVMVAPNGFPDRIGEKVELCLLKVLGRNALLSSDCNGLRT